MAAGQGYIEFATGDVLTAAAANGYLASQVVMVFANAAARTSAIASPQEGMISYLKDTNSTEYYSGTAWAAIGGGGSSGGMTLISTTTLSGASTTINSFSGYTNLLVFIYGATNATANGYAKIDPNNTANITDLNVFGGTSGGGKSYTTAIGTTIYMNYGTDALRTDSNNTYCLEILNYASTASYKPVYFTSNFLNSASARVNETQTGTIRTTSAITSLVITNPGGNWSTGTVLVYGVK